MSAITRFDGEYRFLSNFYPSPIVLPVEEAPLGEDAFVWPTVEHAYQAFKAAVVNDMAIFFAIGIADTPGQAKRLARRLDLPQAWHDRKVDVMELLLRAKFEQNADLADKLLATGDAELIEGNTWGDRFWGRCRGEGENHLGRLLMEQRNRLKATAAHRDIALARLSQR